MKPAAFGQSWIAAITKQSTSAKQREWIRDNIEPKLAGMSGEAIAEMQQPRRTRSKRRR